jgi:hypothetical protein
MHHTPAVASPMYRLLLIASLSACDSLPPDRQANLQQALVVACNIDGAVMPLAQPMVATLGPGGASLAATDSLLVHPAVVAACLRVGGTPVGATPVPAPGPAIVAGPAGQ